MCINECVYVLNQGTDSNNLLSKDAAVKLSIVKFIGGINLEESLFGIGNWDTEPVRLNLKDDASPSAIYCARKVPFHQMNAVD